jgi:F-type H+-transporting ATPase subunit epsilon
MAFRCVVVTPEQQALDESVTQVILPAHDGLIGILTGRAPLLVKLWVGPLRVDLASGQQKTFFIDGGIGQMKDNLLTILTNEATTPEQIDAEKAKADYAQAEATHPTDAKGMDERQRLLARGRIKQQMAAARH